MKRKLTKAEAAHLGGLKGGPIMHARREKRIEKYNQNPIPCKECGKPLTYDQVLANAKFCCSSCAARFNNRSKVGRPVSLETRQKISDKLCELNRSPKQLLDSRTCPVCGKVIGRNHRTYCSNECLKTARKLTESQIIKKTGCLPDNYLGETDSRKAKRYLEELFGRKCAICGESEHNGQPIPLQVHHIDGDATNSSIGNLQLLCPTCHAMTENFGFKKQHKSARPSRKRYWSTAEDRQKVAIYDSEMRAASNLPVLNLPLSDIREDFISDAELLEWKTLQSGPVTQC